MSPKVSEHIFIALQKVVHNCTGPINEAKIHFSLPGGKHAPLVTGNTKKRLKEKKKKDFWVEKMLKNKNDEEHI